MGIFLCLLSFFAAYTTTRRSVASGMGTVLIVGYFYGILRARYLDGVSHFMFDVALLALYLAYFQKRPDAAALIRGARAVRWAALLSIWPVVAMGISTFTGGQHILVQIVGLRSVALMLPVLVIGARLEPSEFHRLVRFIIVLNFISLAFACAELAFGVENFFPENDVTSIIFKSNDVGESSGLRIPSIFNTAHAYGGTMLLSLPFLASLIAEKKLSKRLLGMAAMGASVMGIFISAARTPVVQLGLVVVAILLSGRLSPRVILPVLLVAAGATLVIINDPRFQRFSTLSDPEMVQERLGGSLNKNFIDMVTEYPLGKGMASAVGTSIPYFLQSYAQPQVGLENEYSHLVVEQGIMGLLLWLTLIMTLILNVPRVRKARMGVLSEGMMWALVSVVWMSAFAGAGVLSSVPGSFLLLLQMGILLTGEPAPAPAAHRVLLAA